MYPPEHFRDHLDLMTIEELCSAINVTKQTLAKWRVLGDGPKYARLGKSVFYRYGDVLQWIEASVREPGRLPHNTNAKGDKDPQVDLEELIEESAAEGRDICGDCGLDHIQCSCPIAGPLPEPTTAPPDGHCAGCFGPMSQCVCPTAAVTPEVTSSKRQRDPGQGGDY